VAKHVVQVPVVEGRVEEVLHCRKFPIVAHEAGGIECRRLQNDLDFVVVTVQSGAPMIGR
jgi:Fe-S cluster biogenesis protein NfuA